jgi:hypothetical protein
MGSNKFSSEQVKRIITQNLDQSSHKKDDFRSPKQHSRQSYNQVNLEILKISSDFVSALPKSSQEKEVQNGSSLNPRGRP